MYYDVMKHEVTTYQDNNQDVWTEEKKCCQMLITRNLHVKKARYMCEGSISAVTVAT